VKTALTVALVVLTACLTLAWVGTHTSPCNPVTGGSTPSTNTVIGGGTEVITSNASVLILASPDDAGIVKALQQHFSKAGIVWLNMLHENSNSNYLGADALIIASGNNATLSDPKAIVIAKQFLNEGKTLVVINNAKPISKATLLRFLQEVGVKGVTFDNVKSAIYEKNLDGKKDYIYIFSLRLSKGKYPSMYILDTEEGVKVNTTKICGFITEAVADSLN